MFHEYEKELKRIEKLVKKGQAENPNNNDYKQLEHDYNELEKKRLHTKRSCTIL